MKLHTLAEAGQLLGVSSRTVQRLVADGGLRVVDISTTRGGTRRQLRVRQDDLDAWIEKQTAATR